MRDELPESRESLFTLVTSPTIWAGHFLLSYLTAALWCAKVAGRSGSLAGARWIIAGLTAAALAGIAVTGRSAWKAHRWRGGALPHEEDTAEDRHRLLGAAGLLLSALSAVAVCFTALAAVFFEDCR